MEITPYIADIEAGMNFYYIPGDDGNFHQVPGQRIIVRPRVGYPDEKTLRLALVVVGHKNGKMDIAIIDELSGRPYFKPVAVKDEKFDDQDFLASVIADQVNEILERSESLDMLLKDQAERREKVIREYGPFPEGHGRPVN